MILRPICKGRLKQTRRLIAEIISNLHVQMPVESGKAIQVRLGGREATHAASSLIRFN
jgi:hypothetical protein